MKKLLMLNVFFAMKLFSAAFDTADDGFAGLQAGENERITKRDESYIPFQTLPQRHEIWLSWDIGKCRLMNVTPIVASYDLSKADLWHVRLMPLDEHGENDNRIKIKNLSAFLDEAKPMKDRSKAPAPNEIWQGHDGYIMIVKVDDSQSFFNDEVYIYYRGFDLETKALNDIKGQNFMEAFLKQYQQVTKVCK